MGKSPGKWIKTLLSGKKSAKSSTSKGKKKFANEREVSVPARAPENDSALEDSITGNAPEANSAMEQSITSQPVSTSVEVNDANSEIGREGSNVKHDEDVLVLGDRNVDEQGATPEEVPYDPEKTQLEEAATVVQATFRGYLARRAFRALKGIIRLQALIRGHLVRRQAVASLYCMVGIVKLQAIGRGRKVRQSNMGVEVLEKCKGKLANSEVNLSAQMAKLSANTFICKLLSSSPTVMPLRLQYELEDPNSVIIWLERWSKSYFWKPALPPKKLRDPKSRRRLGNGQHGSSETGRPRRSVRRVPAANIESASHQAVSEPEKPKRNLRKPPSNPPDSAQESGPIELEKVKRSLRKVHNPVIESSLQSGSETEKPRKSLEKGSDASGQVIVEHPKQDLEKATINIANELLDQNVNSLRNKIEKDMSMTVSNLPDVETAENSNQKNESNNIPSGNEAETMLSMETKQDDNTSLVNGDHQDSSPKEESLSKETSDTSKKTSSAAKQECAEPENGAQKTPSLPSYMQATKSAKAKLRLQGSSPRLNQEGAERNGSTRRHSLPSAKITSHSPRTQRPTQSGGKGNKNDKQFSKDGNAKAEWKR